MTSSVCQIEKLNSENYSTWMLQMKSVLIQQEYWGIVNGTCVVTKESSKEEIHQWRSKDEKALAAIILGVRPSELLHVKHCNTAAEAWNKLKELYQPDEPAQKVTLFKRLVQLKMNCDQSMAEHMNHFMEIGDKLREIGVIIPEDLLSIFLLCSLPEEYENFTIAIESRDTLPSLTVLKSKLMVEEQRRNDRVESNPHQKEQAFAAKERTHGRRSLTNTFERPNTKFKGKCYNCGKRGHYASQCRSKAQKGHTVSSFGIFSHAGRENLQISDWFLDSGATSHMCCNRDLFTDITEGNKQVVQLAAKTSIMSQGTGTVTLITNQGGIILNNVLYVPELRGNFLSVSKIAEKDHSIEFKEKTALIKNAKKELVLKAIRKDDLFIVNVKKDNLGSISVMQEKNHGELFKWHRRYGHMNVASLCKLKDMVIGLSLKPKMTRIDCSTCAKAKICEKPFPKQSSHRSENTLELIHTDICGPMRTTSAGGARYFLTFIDDKSRFMHVYFLRSRDEVLPTFKKFKVFVELQTSNKVKMIRSDNGKEYLSKDFNNYLDERGIGRQLTTEYTPQQNGVAERANRTLVEMARCLLIDSKLPENLWGEAVSTAVYLRNRAPTRALDGKTPYEVWTERQPVIKHLRVFGAKVIALIKQPGRNKFNPKGKEYYMVGYHDESKAYRLYDPVTKNIVKSRDVIFFEDKEDHSESVDSNYLFIETPIESLSKESAVTLGSDDSGQNVELTGTSYQVENSRGPGRPKLIRTGKPGRPKKVYSQAAQTLEVKDVEPSVPETVREAMTGKNSKNWTEAMAFEYRSLIEKQTWQLVEKPKNAQIIGCKWVFTIKKKPDGSIERYKARLVAKGCAQKYMVDYYETFSPVVRLSSVRLILALSVQFNLHLHHMDVTTAYLNGNLNEEVFMSQPEGFIDSKFPEKICKLQRPIYGLKQAGREWNKKLNDVLLKIGFSRCNTDTCVYVKNTHDDINIIAVYVDDLLIACKRESQLSRIKSHIQSEFDVIDKGELAYYLGINIQQDKERSEIKMHQQQYIVKLLQKYGMSECKPSPIPLDPGKKPEEMSSSELIDKQMYQSLIGSLMFLAVCTRPDILHSVCKLAQFNTEPTKGHYTAAKQVLRYLRHTSAYGLLYRKSHAEASIVGYADADWANDIKNRHSFTGYVFMCGDGAITWESKKQRIVALSSTEAEYVALCQAAKEVAYLRKFLTELGFKKLIEKPTLIKAH